MAKKKYYAVKKGNRPGIYSTWAEAEQQVKRFSGAQYKGFASREDALGWMNEEGETVVSTEAGHGEDGSPPVQGRTVIYTDGGARNNPGPGGYGAIIERPEGRQELQGGYRLTTNNRMELMACIVALREVEESKDRITLYSDSSYVVNGIAKGWAVNWKRNGWIKSDKKPVLNQDLWQELLQLTTTLDVSFKWVKGHAGNPLNERCDRMAVQSSRRTDLARDEGYEQ